MYYNNRGLAFLRMEKNELCFQDFDMATKLNSHDPNYFFNRGNAYLTVKNVEQVWREGGLAGGEGRWEEGWCVLCVCVCARPRPHTHAGRQPALLTCVHARAHTTAHHNTSSGAVGSG